MPAAAANAIANLISSSSITAQNNNTDHALWFRGTSGNKWSGQSKLIPGARQLQPIAALLREIIDQQLVSFHLHPALPRKNMFSVKP
jgi:hypothetical protein